jgi:hypothetical protein
MKMVSTVQYNTIYSNVPCVCARTIRYELGNAVAANRTEPKLISTELALDDVTND